MAKDFRTNVEFGNSVTISGSLTASAATTTLGTTNTGSLSSTTGSFSSTLKVNGATQSDPLDVKVNTDQMIRMTTFGGYANVESTNLAGTAWSPINIGGSIFSLATAGTNRVTVDGSGNVVMTANLTASGGTNTFGTTTFYRANGIDFAAETGSSASEGGQINLLGGSGYPSKQMQLDNYQGNLRVLYSNGGSVSLTIDQTSGSVLFNNNVGISTIVNSTGTMSLPVTTGRVPSTQFTRSTAVSTNTSSVTWVTPTGMSAATVYSGRTYEYEIVVYVQVSANSAISHLIVAPSGVTAGAITTALSTNTTQISFIGTTATMTSGSNIVSNTTAHNTALAPGAHVLKGFIIPSASGTFTYGGFRNTSSSLTASALANSYMIVTEIA